MLSLHRRKISMNPSTKTDNGPLLVFAPNWHAPSRITCEPMQTPPRDFSQKFEQSPGPHP